MSGKKHNFASFKIKCFIMNVQLLRNASLVLKVNGKTILADPMFAVKGSYDPFMHTATSAKNPITDLPINDTELTKLILQTDAVLLTHVHADHWDARAQELIPKNTLIFCPPVNADVIKQQGFTNVVPIVQRTDWDKIRIYRTGGQHGTGEIGKRMGSVSGYVIVHSNKRLYIAGDTIWCDEVQKTIDTYKPTDIIINGGAARFVTGDPIVMDNTDIIKTCHYAPEANVYVVHLEAVNHATENRSDVYAAIMEQALTEQCKIPDNGEWFM